MEQQLLFDIVNNFVCDILGFLFRKKLKFAVTDQFYSKCFKCYNLS